MLRRAQELKPVSEPKMVSARREAVGRLSVFVPLMINELLHFQIRPCRCVRFRSLRCRRTVLSVELNADLEKEIIDLKLLSE